ncbi:MAG TPA: hypothetical protein PLG43_00220 [Spirochaetia bacterium]|nr:hypothetical protein [Spirochaetia bacterium]
MEKRKPHIGMFGLMPELYRMIPELEKRLSVWVDEILNTIKGFATVTYPGICDTRELVDSAVTAIERSGADMMLVFPVTYAPSFISIRALSRVKLPIAVLNTQILCGFPSDAGPASFTDNEAPTGTFDLTNALFRNRIPFTLISGYSRDPGMYREIEQFANAAMAASELRKVRIGVFGYPMNGSGDFMIDNTLLISHLGAEVIYLDLSELASEAENAPEFELRNQMEQDKKLFTIDKNLTTREHEESSRMEWALRVMFKRYGLSAFTYHFDALARDGRFKTLPMLAACKLLADGYGFGGEGDVTSTAAVTILQKLTGSADFFESWGMDFEVGAVLKNHMGEGNLNYARKDMPRRLVRVPYSFGGSVEYNAVPAFSLQEGEATLINLTTSPDGEISIIAAEGKVPDFKPITGVDSPHGKFKPDTSFKEYLSAYAQAGGTHHGALCYGRKAHDLKMLCDILKLRFTRV